MNKIELAVNFAVAVANDDSHGYDQTYRWNERGDYDCSSLVISAYEQAGIPVKTNGATYTGNMRTVFLECGFSDVTALCNLKTGEGIRRGDVLLNEAHHTALAVEDNGGLIVHASINEKGTATGGKPGDQTGREICTRSYYNKPWDCILRYVGDANLKIVDYQAVGKATVSSYLSVRSGPSAGATMLGMFLSGDMIYINGKCSNGWYRCRIYDGSDGYVSGDFVTIVDTEPKHKELTEPSDIVSVLGRVGIVSDTDSMLAAIVADNKGKLYWLAHNIAMYLNNR